MRSRVILLKVVVAILSILLIAGRCEYLSQPYFDQLAARIDDDQPPDVGYMDVLRAPEYIREGRLRPLDGLIDANDLADFYAPLLANFQREGRTYLCPRDFQTVALLVNVELFEETGLEPPTTWDEFSYVVETMADMGYYGVGLSPDLWNWMPFLFQAGGSLLDESGTEMTLLTEEAEEALAFYTDLHLDGYAFMPEDESWPPYQRRAELLTAFVQGEVAMIFGANDSYTLLRAELGDRVQVAELPEGPDGKATIAYAVGYGLFSDAGTEPGPALDLLHLICSREGMEIWAESPIYMPTRQSMREEWVAMHPDAAAFMAGVDYLHSYQPAIASHEAIEAFDRQANLILTKAMRGEISVDEALEMLQEGNATLQGR
jgi:multiple sugar transport system substrate-binding protein